MRNHSWYSIGSLTEALHKRNIAGLISDGILKIQSEQRLSTCISVSLTQEITGRRCCIGWAWKGPKLCLQQAYTIDYLLFIYLFLICNPSCSMNAVSLPVGILYFKYFFSRYFTWSVAIFQCVGWHFEFSFRNFSFFKLNYIKWYLYYYDIVYLYLA